MIPGTGRGESTSRPTRGVRETSGGAALREDGSSLLENRLVEKWKSRRTSDENTFGNFRRDERETRNWSFDSGR